MDGNGRWAANRHLPRVEGTAPASTPCATRSRRRRGSASRVLTLYAFSVENWKRPDTEITALMGLLKHYLRLELKTLLKNNIRFHVIGQPRSAEPGHPRRARRWPRRGRRANTGMLFNIALSYGGRAEIVDAARRAIREGVDPDALDERTFASFLYTAGQPDPDLLIRTSGEMRVSNFLLWQIAYAEIWVTDALVAGLPRAASARGRRRLPEARSPLRRDRLARRSAPGSE